MPSADDPGRSHLERAKLLAAELLDQHVNAIRSAAEVAALRPYGDVELEPTTQRWIVELAHVVASATVNALVALKPAQYRGPNGDYVTVERLAKLRDALSAPNEEVTR